MIYKGVYEAKCLYNNSSIMRNSTTMVGFFYIYMHTFEIQQQILHSD